MRVRFSGKERMVIDGLFAETEELVAGFWMWRVKSMDNAIAWLKRAAFAGGEEVEIRPIFEAEDFGAELTPELREKEERLRAEAQRRSRSTSNSNSLDGLGRVRTRDEFLASPTGGC